MNAENIDVFTQNSIRIRTDDKKIYIDPFQMKESPSDADFILITHDHYDHFSPEDIEKVTNGKSVLVVPEKMSEKAEEVKKLVGKIVTVRADNSYDIDGLSFVTIPAYNLLKPFHSKSAGWIGYILNLDGKRIYIAGDTDATKEAKSVKCDIALVPIGGTYTMDPKKAAELINIIRPETAIPVHYGTIVGNPKDADKFIEYVDNSINVEIKIK
ncbi:MAG: MBL fold metallo-hydrolase [Lachnospiraceae bacterium]|nr:MBL fold metallo-hydrolase [Lachnospiraceae bacterium]